jgi:hypothetical protein
MKNHIICLIVLLVMVSFPSCKKEQAESVRMSVQISVGDARIASDRGEKAVAAGDVLSPGDTLITGPGASVDIDVGNKGIIRINESSIVRMSALLAGLEKEEVRLDMKTGNLFVILSKLSRSSTFKIVTPTTIAAVRGTSFRVVADQEGSRIDVLKGVVRIQPVKQGRVAENIEKLVEANRTAVISERIVDDVIAGKKEIEVASLSSAKISDIKKEIKDIKTDSKLTREVLDEYKEIILDQSRPEPKTVKKHAAAKKGKPVVEDKLKEEKKLLEMKKKEEKEKRVQNIPNL